MGFLQNKIRKTYRKIIGAERTQVWLAKMHHLNPGKHFSVIYWFLQLHTFRNS